MCFGESFYYALPTPLTVGQAYTVSMNVSTGQLGASTIISGNHTFNIIGLTSAPTNCGGANYGSVCSTPGATVLLSGTVNTIGWVNFTNTFTATSAIQYIVIGNCDGTGNGGNLFCNFTLTNAIVFPAEVTTFDAVASGCQVDLNWSIDRSNQTLSHFELIKSVEGKSEEVLLRQATNAGLSDYSFSDLGPAINSDYQLRIYSQDGGVSQSKVLHVQADCEEQRNTIEGNPVKDTEAVLRFHSDGSPTLVTISSVNGQVVSRIELSPSEAGWHRAKLDVSTLQPGIYFVSTGKGNVTKLQVMR